MKLKELKGCARCDEDHINLEMYPFSKHPIEDKDGIWTHYVICPNTNEPVLVMFINRKDLINLDELNPLIGGL